MREIYLKRVIGVFCLILAVAICMTGCGTSNNANRNDAATEQDTMSKEEILPDQDGNPYSTHKIVDGDTIVEYDYNEAYEKLDLSEYTEHGKFGEDGIMWVKKSDYTGVQYGYIDYNGNIIMPLTSEIEEVDDFNDGFSSIKYKKDFFGFPKFSVINTAGKILFDYYTTADIGERVLVVNDNIVMAYNVAESIDINAKFTNTIYFSKTDTLINIDKVNLCSIENAPIMVSDGLIRIATYEWKGVAYHSPCTVRFYDENGELVLKIDDNSNDNYEYIQYIENFIDGKTTLTFKGKNNKFYNVTINKQGEWLDEPIEVQENSIKKFVSN